MIVAEAYLRIEIILSDRDKREIGAILLGIAESAGGEFFAGYETARIGEAVIEDGSSKLRARIRTSAIALMTFVGGYGTVRSGLDYMQHDGKAAATWMVNRVEPTLPETPDVRRRRAPVATRLRRLFDQVEAGEISAAEASQRAEQIFREYREPPDTVRLVVAQLSQEFAAIQPIKRVPRKQSPVTIDRRIPSPIRRGKRLSVFRDPRTGAIRYVEE